MCDVVRSCGGRPVLVTRAENRARLGDVFQADLPPTVFVEHLDDPVPAADEIERQLRDGRIALRNWVSIPDSLTDTFLYTSNRLGLNFPMLAPYTHCRVKPLARALTGGVRHVVHWLHDDQLPWGPDIPFIAKPLTGTGSEDVRMINGSSDWPAWLSARRAKAKAPCELAGFRPSEQGLVEEHLRGAEYEIDGYVFRGKP